MEANCTQAQIAAQYLARAIRERFASVSGAQEGAAGWVKIAGDLAELLPKGDYDVLVARKLRAVADLIRSGNISLEMVESEMRELLAELREAFGEEKSS
jgi:hypothetical protein